MSNIIDDLKSLSDEELEKVGNLINKFVRRKGDAEEKGQTTPRKTKRTNKPRQTPEKAPKTAQRGKGRTSPKNPENVQEQPARRGQGGKRGKTRLCRTEPVQLAGYNKFDKMPERRSNQQDREIDKKLNPNPVPREKTNRQFQYSEVQCRHCNLWFDVHPSLVYVDPDEGVVYTCDGCSKKQ